MLALCHLSADKNTNKGPTFPPWKYTISKNKKTKKKTFYLRGTGSKWELHKIVLTLLESIFGVGVGAGAVLGKLFLYFGSTVPTVLHCQEKGLHLMTSKPSASFKIFCLLDNGKDYLKCPKPYIVSQEMNRKVRMLAKDMTCDNLKGMYSLTGHSGRAQTHF